MPRTEMMAGLREDSRATLWLPLVTPMQGGELDLACAQRLAAHYVASGVDGLVILGTTGEGGLLTRDERLMFTAAVLEAVDGALPVLAGVGGVDTRVVCEQVRQLDRFDLAGYLVPPPYYLRPGDEGIAWHVERVADATWRPLMLYNVPKRTGCNMSPALVQRLAAHPRVVAVKECDAAGLRALAGNDRLAVFCGEDAAMLDHLLAGGDGVVPACAHIRPDLFVRLLQLVAQGRVAEARALFASLSPLISLLFSEPNPAPVKTALALCGLAGSELRRPLVPASRALRERLDQVIASLPAVEDVERTLLLA
ncbi:4-hydroxy-tetrahydrodipicolinate synthase [Cupriavidus basilensis]|uniref:4-hydroxy-tetrahydrodipicolinate synthase n=1 Tax=Cupriavidus basilensis TaxID=68895 RepID=UPI0020A64317|nr:4-hydroxy-tetrahydrodipicolinate synthase [Cupriavidus basilensis]MCP3021956.1 4-hydroxy-tetrahydrodipicolinate synthase [Cupriavidus basilensis]MDR3384954.1 4-hydroxy-tetrahydrodipicolinate synthase [Cupriavidus basilensis]